MKETENTIYELSENLAKGYLQAVRVLGRAAETVEKYYDGGHSRFVSDMSAQVAADLGMNDEDIMEVRIAGLLHDIGKLGFPDTCLYKYTSEMTESEYSRYKKHPELGMHLLEPYELFANIGEIIFQHHEKLDGSGFPGQLTGGKIHPAAKIIIVVDYYHNQIFKRQRARGEYFSGAVQYSSTLSYLESTRDRYNSALNFLTKKSNILFDSKVVDSFINIIEAERKDLGMKSVMRISVHSLEPGYVFAEDYLTSYGLLIAAKGETITPESLNALKRFVNADELPQKILVMK
ncbi:MAG: HD domain-containing phosphohydrolase [Candidatus Kapaibacterium sp.]